jgi:hypothetical protein
LIADRIPRAVASTCVLELQQFLDEYDHELHERGDFLLISYRNLIQTKQFLLESDVVGVRTQSVWALIHLGDCEYARHSDIQFILASFSKLVSRAVYDWIAYAEP